MKQAGTSDIPRAIQILTESFQTNPSALWVIKQDHKVQKRLRALIDYAVKTGMQNDGVFLSDDESTAAICFEEPASENLKSYWHQVELILRAITLPRVPQVLKREAYLKAHRPEGPHLNFWFLGVDPRKKGSGGVHDIKKGIFQLAKEKNLPILLETSVQRNKDVYEYFGFHTYHTWKQSEDYTLWFMRRDWP